MIYRIADFNFDIETVCPQTARFCGKYACDAAESVDCVIRMTEEDIRSERARGEAEGVLICSDSGYEQLALYRKICAYVLAHDAFLMHCAVIEYEGRGYAFSAPSGTGKTTHIRLWQRVFGEDKVTVVNGDKPLLRLIDGKIYAYGTPWCGKEGYNVNTRVPLSGLCFITRGTENKIRMMSTEEAVPHLFGQIMVSDSTDLARQMELADLLLQKVPCYLLSCNMDTEAAQVAYAGMCGMECGEHD